MKIIGKTLTILNVVQKKPTRNIQQFDLLVIWQSFSFFLFICDIIFGQRIVSYHRVVLIERILNIFCGTEFPERKTKLVKTYFKTSLR